MDLSLRICGAPTSRNLYRPKDEIPRKLRKGFIERNRGSRRLKLLNRCVGMEGARLDHLPVTPHNLGGQIDVGPGTVTCRES